MGEKSKKERNPLKIIYMNKLLVLSNLENIQLLYEETTVFSPNKAPTFRSPN
jgi:hypothetical protein